MKVRAIEGGFFGGSRRRAGSVFEVPDGTTSRWFVPVASPHDSAPAPAERSRRERKTLSLSEIGRERAVGPLDQA